MCLHYPRVSMLESQLEGTEPSSASQVLLSLGKDSLRTPGQRALKQSLL